MSHRHRRVQRRDGIRDRVQRAGPDRIGRNHRLWCRRDRRDLDGCDRCDQLPVPLQAGVRAVIPDYRHGFLDDDNGCDIADDTAT